MKLEKEHLTEREVAQFQRRELTQAKRRELDAHVAQCEDCLRRVLNPAESPLALTSLTEAFIPSADEQPFHLSRAELQRYNHENLDEADRTIFESHMEICSECKEEAATLQAAASIAPFTVARSDERIESETKSRPRWFPAFARPAAFRNSPALAVGIIAAVGCVLLILALWIQKKPARTQEQQAAQTEQRDNRERPAIPQSNSIEPAPGGVIAGGNNNASAPADINNSNTPTEEPKVGASPSVVRLKDGGAEVGLDEQGKLKGLESLAPQTQRAVQTALASEHLPEPPALNELAGAKIILMGQATDGLPFKLISPVGIVIRHNRPTLRWHSLDGATSYTVSVFDSDFNRVAKSNPQSAREWTLPTSLRNGKVYSWEVTALKENQEVTSPVAPAPRAQFKIVEGERLKEIASVLKERPRSHLTLGVLYARAGLLTEAENELRALLNDNPQSSVAKRLLRTVQAWRGR
jgi:anti-sigma factor RsiW